MARKLASILVEEGLVRKIARPMNEVDFTSFIREVEGLVEREREARTEYQKTVGAVSERLREFGEKFRRLPKEFDRAWAVLFQAAREHRSDKSTTVLLEQVREAQRLYDEAHRAVYGY